MLHVAAALRQNAKVFAVKLAGAVAIGPLPHEAPEARVEAISDAAEAFRDTGGMGSGRTAADAVEGWDDFADADIATAALGSATTPADPPTVDSRDIAALYERHAPAIYAHCRRLLGSAPAGRDALQESFVRVLQHHRVLGPGDQALRYLYRTSTNVCINLLRQRSVRERAAPLIAAQSNAAQSNQPVPGDREFVRLLLEQCDETAVAVALMHFVDGMTQVEVAATLGITRRTVYNRIRRIERLAADLMEPNLPAADVAEHEAR